MFKDKGERPIVILLVGLLLIVAALSYFGYINSTRVPTPPPGVSWVIEDLSCGTTYFAIDQPAIDEGFIVFIRSDTGYVTALKLDRVRITGMVTPPPNTR